MKQCIKNKIRNYHLISDLGDPFTQDNDSYKIISEHELTELIILPILHCLGWDAFMDYLDLDCPESDIPEGNVDRGYSIRGGIVDYVLMNGWDPIVFVECKRGDRKLNKSEKQILRYLSIVSVKMGILTNGSEWRFFLNEYVYNQYKGKCDTINLLEDNIDECTDKFFKYVSRENVYSGKSNEYLENSAIMKYGEEFFL